MRTISNKEAREMTDTRKLMASALWAYRWAKRDNPNYFTQKGCRYRSFLCESIHDDSFGYHEVVYDTQDNTLHVEAYDKKRELIQIMIFE